MTTESTQQSNINGNNVPNMQNKVDIESEANTQSGQPRVVSNPSEVANLVLMQIDAVNSKKDELTIAMKQLTDTTKQLVRAYGEHTSTIVMLKKNIEEFEEVKKEA